MSVVTFIDEAQAPPQPERRGAQRSRNIDAHRKQCRTCNRILPFRLFVATGTYIKSIGRLCGSADCRDCLERKRRAAGIPERHVKVNARGEVYCSNCKKYLPSSQFKPHPNAKKPDGGNGQKWWAYCKPCTRELDRMRWTGERRERLNKQNVINHRKRRAAEFRERRTFLADAIELLLRRGLTISEAARCSGVSLGNLYKYRDKATKRPTEAVVARFERLLWLTMDWPLGEPAYRRRLPHPKLPELLAAMASTIAAHPMRDSWKSGTRRERS